MKKTSKKQKFINFDANIIAKFFRYVDILDRKKNQNSEDKNYLHCFIFFFINKQILLQDKETLLTFKKSFRKDLFLASKYSSFSAITFCLQPKLFHWSIFLRFTNRQQLMGSSSSNFAIALHFSFWFVFCLFLHLFILQMHR